MPRHRPDRPTAALDLDLSLALALALAFAAATGCAGAAPTLDPPPARPASSTAAAPAPRPAQARCAPGPELPEGWLAPGAAVLFGDWHGTDELPAFFGEVACRVAAAGRPVLVGLELPRDEQPTLDRFLAEADPRAAEAGLLAGPFWRRSYQDGRSSQAMSALLGRLRQLRRAGLRLDVRLFDVEQEAMGADRDMRMAALLAGWAHARGEAVLLVLAGNFHTRTAVGAPWDPEARPMGFYLRQAGLALRALDCGGPEGTSWSCTGAEAASCGVQPVDLRAPPGGEPAVELFAERSSLGYDGRYTVPRLSASPPAVAGAGGR